MACSSRFGTLCESTTASTRHLWHSPAPAQTCRRRHLSAVEAKSGPQVEFKHPKEVEVNDSTLSVTWLLRKNPPQTIIKAGYAAKRVLVKEKY